MKWTVQRYVLREVVQTWLAVTGVLVAILVSNQLSRVLGQAADNQYGRRVVFDLITLGEKGATFDRFLEGQVLKRVQGVVVNEDGNRSLGREQVSGVVDGLAEAAGRVGTQPVM